MFKVCERNKILQIVLPFSHWMFTFVILFFHYWLHIRFPVNTSHKELTNNKYFILIFYLLNYKCLELHIYSCNYSWTFSILFKSMGPNQTKFQVILFRKIQIHCVHQRKWNLELGKLGNWGNHVTIVSVHDTLTILKITNHFSRHFCAFVVSCVATHFNFWVIGEHHMEVNLKTQSRKRSVKKRTKECEEIPCYSCVWHFNGGVSGRVVSVWARCPGGPVFESLTPSDDHVQSLPSGLFLPTCHLEHNMSICTLDSL